MLSDAGIKPSRRVWSDVSRRLDAGAVSAAAANSLAWAKWAGVCLAAAAAIAAGVFLFDPIPTYHHIQKEETVARVDGPSVSGKQPIEQEPVAITVPAPKAVDKARTAEAVPTAQIPEPVVTAAETVADETATAATPETKTPQAKAPQAKAPATFDDPFARMAREDSGKKKRPAQFYFGGGLGGNDSDFTSIARVSRLSSSVTMTKSGITELGDSSFGVPFTLGVGARFYLAPKFSIGTGIDYSLLTRSFEGRYNNVNGGIIEQTASGTFFHAMHYIGIPIDAYYDFVAGNKVKFYGYAGGEAEYCVANRYHLYSEKFTYSEAVKGLQWSVGAGLGVEFKVADFLGIYIDPGVRYYFESQHPLNVRTRHPVLINLDAGLRFNF